MLVLIVLLVLAAIGTGLYGLSRNKGGGAGGAPSSSGGSHSASPAANTVLTPVKAGGFDALGLGNDPGNEDNAGAGLAIDNNPHTAWHTQFYFNYPRFGNLKAGTGLILDMGKPVRLSSVQVTFGPAAGANVDIEVGNNNSVSPAGLASFTKVAKEKNVGGGTQTFPTSSSASGQLRADLVHQAAAERRQSVPGVHLQRRPARIGLTRGGPARPGAVRPLGRAAGRAARCRVAAPPCDRRRGGVRPIVPPPS